MTTASTTEFVSARIYGADGRYLWIDGNQKITAGNGSFGDPKPNAFSLMQIEDCPGSTPTCRKSCYVHNLEKHAPDVHALYKHNSKTIREILANTYLDWADTMAAWISRNCAGGFRWHVSGDVFSADYADWIVDVCRHSPAVRHWIYTRSLDLLEALNRSENLVVNISADRDNFSEAAAAADEYGLRLCYMTEDGAVPETLCTAGDVIFPDYKFRNDQQWITRLPVHQRRMVCPVDFRGKSEDSRCGPCRKCME